jgi:hypothetical protein
VLTPPEGWPHLTQVIRRIHTSSALNPLLWLCGLTTLSSWGIGTFLTGWLQVELFCFGTLPPICAIVAFFYLLFKDPDRLQSERFQLTRQQYRLIGDDLRRGQVIESASEVIANPVAEAKEGNSDGT